MKKTVNNTFLGGIVDADASLELKNKQKKHEKLKNYFIYLFNNGAIKIFLKNIIVRQGRHTKIKF